MKYDGNPKNRPAAGLLDDFQIDSDRLLVCLGAIAISARNAVWLRGESWLRGETWLRGEFWLRRLGDSDRQFFNQPLGS